MFPDADPLAVDLLTKMLSIDPDQRIGAEEAMRHPYFSSLFYEDDIHLSTEKFNFAFEMDCKNVGDIKRKTFEYLVEYNDLGRDEKDATQVRKRRRSMFDGDIVLGCDEERRNKTDEKSKKVFTVNTV